MFCSGNGVNFIKILQKAEEKENLPLQIITKWVSIDTLISFILDHYDVDFGWSKAGTGRLASRRIISAFVLEGLG